MKDIGLLYSGLSGKAADDFAQDENIDNKDFIPFTNIFNNDTINPNVMGKVVVYKSEKQNKVKKGDLFFLTSSEDYDGLGKSSLLTLDLKEIYLNSLCKGFRITKMEVFPAFLKYQLQSDTFRKILQIEGKEFTRMNYRKLLRKYGNNEQSLFAELIPFLIDRIKSSANMALFFNSNKNFTFKGLTFILFAPSGSELRGDIDFNENIFSVVQELPYKYKHNEKIIFSFRPDLTFFLNGFYLGYSELKSNWNNQDARKNGRSKVTNDCRTAVEAYLKIANNNDVSQSIRRNILRIFDKSILPKLSKPM